LCGVGLNWDATGRRRDARQRGAGRLRLARTRRAYIFSGKINIHITDLSFTIRARKLIKGHEPSHATPAGHKHLPWSAASCQPRALAAIAGQDM